MKFKACRMVNSAIVFCLIGCSSLYGQTAPGRPEYKASWPAGTSSDLPQSSTSYTIQSGDSLGKILREEFRLPDDIIFSPQTLSLLQTANPHLLNLSDLRAGEKLSVPAALLQQQPRGGEGLVKTQQFKQRHAEDITNPDTAASPAAAGMQIKKGPSPEHAPAQAYISESEDSAIREKSIAAAETLQNEIKVRHLLSSFAAAFGGWDNETCEKTAKIQEEGTFTLDCSKFPLYEFPWGNKIILDYGKRLPESLQQIIAAAWSKTEIISVTESAAAKSVLDRAIEVCGLQKMESGNRYTVSRNDAQIILIGDWIVFNKTERMKISLLSLDGGTSLPDPLKKYLAKLGIDFISLGGHRTADCPSAEFSAVPSVDKKTDPAAFTDALLELAGIAYQRNVKTKLIPRQDTGITLEVITDRKFPLHGKTCCIVFKNISENMLNLFQSQGFKVLQIDRSQPLSNEEVVNLLNFLDIKNTSPTASFQYDHSSSTAIKISFPGFLIHAKKGDYLLTNAQMDFEIINFINNMGIKIINF